MPSTTRRALAAVSAALAAAAGLVLAGGGSASAANLLANPGFESGTAGWTCSGATTTSEHHSGSSALKATPSGQDNARCSQTVTVTPGARYTLSAWVKGAYTYLGATGATSGDASTWTPTAGAWTKLSVPFTAASSTVTVYVHGWYGQPAYLADDITLDGPGTTPPDPTTTPPPTTTTTAPPTTTTPPTTPPTTQPPVAGLPAHVLTGYWQNFDNGATPLRLAAVPTTYDIIAISFADAVPTTPGAVTFTLDPGLSASLGGYTDAQFRADVATVRGRGQKVILSVGGEKGTISVGDPTASANFAASVNAVIDDYGFDGVDIDLENGINAQHMATALRAIHAGGGTVITMAPQTIDMQSTSGGYFQLALAVKDILTIVNMQYYNSGAMLGCDGKVYSQGSVDFLTALACIQLKGGLRPDQVGLGLPASTRAAGGGHQSPASVSAGLTCLAKGTGCGTFTPPTTYPALRGAMTWSINWDASNGYAFANAVSATLDTLP